MKWWPSKKEKTTIKQTPDLERVLSFYNVMPKAKLSPEAKPEPSILQTQAPAAVLPQVTNAPPPPPVSPKLTVINNGPATKTKRPQITAKQIISVVTILMLLAAGALAYSIKDTIGSRLHLDFLAKLREAKQNNTAPTAPAADAPGAGIEPSHSLNGYQTAEAWRQKYFAKTECDTCKDDADPDGDGLSNLLESQTDANPTKADTDGDGLADGDEVNIFNCSPTSKNSNGNLDYTDADSLRGGWSCEVGVGDKIISDNKLADIKARSGQYSFHEPTITTLGEKLSRYGAVVNSLGKPQEVKLPPGVSAAAADQLARDVQRLNTVRKIGAGLLKYKIQSSAYPDASFTDMASLVKPYLQVATNSQDPVNVAPLVYGYEYDPAGNSFALTYYSETQKQLIKYTEAQAKSDSENQGAQDRDSQRMQDMDKIRSALLIYSAANTGTEERYLFPKLEMLEQALSPQYIQVLPRDPKTKLLYEYAVSKDGLSFTLKSVLELPTHGTTGYICNQEECRMY